MTNLDNYLDANGNFTHTKIKGTKDQIAELIQKYRETEFFKDKTDSQKILMEMYFFPQIIESGKVPNGMLLELVMPSAPEGCKFSDLKVGTEITFDLPPRFKQVDSK